MNQLSDSLGWSTALRCPECRAGALSRGTQELMCADCGATFPILGGTPVLLRRDNELFAVADYVHAAESARAPTRGSALARVIPSPSVNLSRGRVLTRLSRMLDEFGPCDVLVVGGGRQRSWLDPLIRARVPHRLCYVDIDVDASVEVFCDAHDLPFVEGSFAAVITTAVLELVMYPERAAAEMARVIRAGGFIYSEVPFIQQVHEGAYDFTRYTLGGHRRLLSAFAELDAGMVAGPATALVWSIENLALALAPRLLRSPTKAAARLLFSWLKYLDLLVRKRPHALDGASCTYFLGQRREGGQRTPDAEIVQRYAGGMKLSHT